MSTALPYGTVLHWRNPYDPRTVHSGHVCDPVTALIPFRGSAYADSAEWAAAGLIPVWLGHSTRYPHDAQASLPPAGIGHKVLPKLDGTIVWLPADFPYITD